MSGIQRASVVPDILDALVARFSELLPGTGEIPVTVSDGYALTNNPGDYLYFGTGTDPLAESPTPAATVTQEFVNTRGLDRDETGTIGGTIDVLEGSREDAQKLARDRAFALLATVESELRANPTLKSSVAPGGVVGLLHVRVGGYSYTQGLTSSGVASMIAFDLAFRARI